MTTELEKKFFEAFDIKPEEEKYCYWECKIPELKNIACKNTGCEHYRHEIYYPYIEDSTLLSLVKIACKENIISLTRMKNGSKEWAVYFGLDKSCIFYEKSFKDVILKAFIEYSNDRDIYTRVQKLFERE